ncbi:DUF2795 domain-containing protein [Streptomyces tendae]|uniref:DUF2795 domain-containing protein n=1 Tax=Streptomyces tendae TaxID=1932 RepID=UPI003D65B99B
MADLSPIDLQKALKGADYPAAMDDLVSVAKSNGADDNLVKKLSQTGTKQFDGPTRCRRPSSATNDHACRVRPPPRPALDRP